MSLLSLSLSLSLFYSLAFLKLFLFVFSLQVFGKFLMVYFLFGKMPSLLWPICDIIGLIFIATNG